VLRSDSFFPEEPSKDTLTGTKKGVQEVVNKNVFLPLAELNFILIFLKCCGTSC
jgi:hypothetical protein